MLTLILLILSFVTLIALCVVWMLAIRSSVIRANTIRRRLEGDDKTVSSYQLDDVNLAVFRDCVLAAITLGLNLYVVYYLLPRYFVAPPSNSLVGVANVDVIPPIIKGVVSITAFVIALGFTLRFVPSIFPWDPKSYSSKILSITTSIGISLIFSLYLMSSTSLIGNFVNQIGEGFFAIITAFAGITITSIGVYLFWTRIKRFIWPG